MLCAQLWGLGFALAIITDASQDSRNACLELSTCGACIETTEARCAWCQQEAGYDINYHEARCDTVDNLLAGGCDSRSVKEPGHYARGEPYSHRCSQRGTYECDACTCNTGSYGPQCQCDGSDVDGRHLNSCKMTNHSSVCAGHGRCVCGACECDTIRPQSSLSERFTGRYCECNDYACDYDNNLICGGPEQGQCACGVCRCEPGYQGNNCGCSINKDSCMSRNGLICNGKGTCNCGRCSCDTDPYYRGPQCEDCPACEGKCTANKVCVQCVAFNSGPYTAEECEANCNGVQMVDVLTESPNRRMCQFRDEDGCVFYFAYLYDSPDQVTVQRTKECPGSDTGLASAPLVTAHIQLFAGVTLLLPQGIISARCNAQYCAIVTSVTII